jgi:two-component system, cell cycle sensor histidine kinase and response regulator CckA
MSLVNMTNLSANVSSDRSSFEPSFHRREAMPSSGRVLIMDDEDFIQDVTREVLLELGYEVEVSSDGLEALEKYERAMMDGKRFDVVIMDLTISGGMGGKEAIKGLLEIDPHAKALVSSGHSNDPVMVDCRSYGFAGAIPKPYMIAELSFTMANILKKDKADEGKI